MNRNSPQEVEIGTLKNYVQVNFKTAFTTPTVGRPNYTFVTVNLQRDSANAREIINTKILHPLAMQRHDANFFDSLVTKDFINRRRVF